jgi:HD domain
MDSGEQRLLAQMPLHAITAMHGEAGLRERFSLETASFAGPDRARIGRALELAARLHAGDRRQREPYVNHLLRVATRIICYYGIRDADVVCAALLHDAVEDHPGELAASGGMGAAAPGSGAAAVDGAGGSTGAALAVLAAEFGPRVAELVGAVTNPDYVPGQDKGEQYRAHVAASLAASPWARVIKISDFTDNGVGLIHTTGPALTRLAGKYAPLVPVLRDLINRPDTPLSRDARALILRQLDRAQQRFTAILDGPPSPASVLPAPPGSAGAEADERAEGLGLS